MSETIVQIDGVRWKLPNAGAVLARWTFLTISAPLALPRVVLGCERCASICVSVVSDCACCQRYKTRTAGGSLMYATISGGPGLFNYDPSAPAHRAIAPFADVIEQLKGYAA